MSFVAQYGGVCDSCDHRIKPGQEVDYNSDDELVHVFCEETRETNRAVCLPLLHGASGIWRVRYLR